MNLGFFEMAHPSICLGGPLFLSGIASSDQANKAVHFFVILPMFLARPFGLVLPFVELLCRLGLLFGVLTRLSALGIGLLSLSFLIAKTIVFLHGRSVNCRCFGAFGDTLASVTIFLDLPMMFFAMVVMWAPSDVRHWRAVGNVLPKTWRERLKFIW